MATLVIFLGGLGLPLLAGILAALNERVARPETVDA